MTNYPGFSLNPEQRPTEKLKNVEPFSFTILEAYRGAVVERLEKALPDYYVLHEKHNMPMAIVDDLEMSIEYHKHTLKEEEFSGGKTYLSKKVTKMIFEDGVGKYDPPRGDYFWTEDGLYRIYIQATAQEGPTCFGYERKPNKLICKRVKTF